jgi:hypothetical protein
MKWLRLAVFGALGFLSLIPIVVAACLLSAHGPIMFGHDPQVWITNDFGEITIEVFHGRDFGKDHQTIFMPQLLRSTLSLLLFSIIPSIVWLHFLRRKFLQPEK